MIQVAGSVAAVLLLSVAAFQAALAFGAPLGRATMGGRARTRNGVLERPFRVAAATSGVILAFAAWVIAVRAGVLGDGRVSPTIHWATWAVAAFMVVNTAGNFAGRHPLERRVMGPITIVVAMLTAGVAIG